MPKLTIFIKLSLFHLILLLLSTFANVSYFLVYLCFIQQLYTQADLSLVQNMHLKLKKDKISTNHTPQTPSPNS